MGNEINWELKYKAIVIGYDEMQRQIDKLKQENKRLQEELNKKPTEVHHHYHYGPPPKLSL